MEISRVTDLIILISEKGGLQARDNGFAYFKHRINLGYKNTYYIYDRKNIDIDGLSAFKKNIVLKNSYKHKKLFYKADYLILNDGYMDVFPEFNKMPLSKGWAPIVYLQHGIIAYKKIHFYKGHYNGRVRYFSTSLKKEKYIVSDILQSKIDIYNTNKLIAKYKVPHLKSYVEKRDLKDLYVNLLRTYYSDSKNVEETDLKILKKLIMSIGFLDCRIANCGLPRHEGLVDVKKKNKSLLFFFTWRDEWTKDSNDNSFLQLVREIKTSDGILRFAEKNNLQIRFYLHEKILGLKDKLYKIFDGKIDFAGQDDFHSVLEETAICVTDYSSVAFEFNLLKTPVLFLHFDYDNYKYERGHFLSSPYDFLGVTVRTVKEMERFFIGEHSYKNMKRMAQENYLKVKNDYEGFGKTNKYVDSLIDSPQRNIIFFCYNAYGVGGTVQTIINQANYLVSIGFMVTIVSLRKTSDTPVLNLDPSVRIEFLNDVRSRGRYRTYSENILSGMRSRLFYQSEDLYSGLSLLTDVKLLKVIKSIKNSILVGTFPGICINLIKNSDRTNKVIVQEHKEFNSHSEEIKKSIIKYYKYAWKIIVLTEFQISDYRKNGIKRIINIPNGIEDQYSLLSEVISNKKKNRIVSFGRLVEMKQFDLLIESFSIIATKYPDWRLDIYGDGEQKSRLLEMIENLSLQAQIRIYPPTSLVYEELYNSDFCVLTSSREGFGMVYIESFSMGKPVVSFDIEYGPKEFLQHEYNSLVSPCFDINHLANQMERLMNDDDLLNAMGKNARRTYIERYEISKVVSRFLEACD
ncbi:TPA: glycosyltransferase [Kluyvera cryocrescens]